VDRLEDLDHGMKRVAIVGGGYAGIASAIRLAECGIACTIFESGKVLGGRARRVVYRDTVIDNGQHILSGAYTELLRMMQLVGTDADDFERRPLRLTIAPQFHLQAPDWPAPLHLAWALLSARGLGMADRFAAVRLMTRLRQAGYRVPADWTVAELLAAHDQPSRLTHYLWQPLTISALNTPIATASAQIFANVLRDALGSTSEASHLLLPKTDLSALFPEPAAKWLFAHGGSVNLSARVTKVARAEGGFAISVDDSVHPFDSTIVAVGPHQFDAIELPCTVPALHGLSYEPINTVYLQFAQRVALADSMIGCTGGLTQWFFDRHQLSPGKAPPGLIAGVISASGPHESLGQDELAKRVHDELQSLAGPLPPLVWQKVIAEKFATFACVKRVHRPGTDTTVPGLYLAGDYVNCDYPATLEAAVRNGVSAADAAISYLSGH
jgi:squalene-associated FAD-dependent desaturase